MRALREGEMKRLVVVGLVALMLGGCITRARHERELAEADQKEDTFCTSIGARPGSASYTDCRLKMRQERVRKQALENAARRADVMCTPIAGVGTVCN